MRSISMTCALAAAFLILAPVGSGAAQPEQLSQKTFEVLVDGSSSPPTVEVTFALALSDSSSYPVTITAIAGENEEVLYEGSLPEGVWRLRAPVKIAERGEPLKIVLKAKVLDQKAGNSNLVYRKWEGQAR